MDISELLRTETRSLVGFLTMLTGDRHAADDLFQETCLEILRIQDRFEPGTDFSAWSRSVARFQVLRYWRTQGRNKVLPFSPETLEQLEAAWAAEPASYEDFRADALKGCMSELQPEQQETLRWRYTERWSHQKIATSLGKSVDAVKMLMSRLRKKLRLCVEMKMTDAELQQVEVETHES
jgi:RNA polymerase sigma-70 factor (ECF subfamily)